MIESRCVMRFGRVRHEKRFSLRSRMLLDQLTGDLAQNSSDLLPLLRVEGRPDICRFE